MVTLPFLFVSTTNRMQHYKIVRKPQWKKISGRPHHRGKDNVNVDFMGTKCKGVDKIKWLRTGINSHLL
jgi:hypothetical protein